MSKAIGDPDELDRFGYALSEFVETLNEALGSLNHSFSTVGESWQDEKRARFEEDFNLLMQQLSRFESCAAEQTPWIHALASRLREYLQS